MAGVFVAVCCARNYNPTVEGATTLLELYPKRRIDFDLANWFFTTNEIPENRRQRSERKLWVCRACIARARMSIAPTFAGSLQVAGPSGTNRPHDFRRMKEDRTDMLTATEFNVILDYIEKIQSAEDAKKIQDAVEKRIHQITAEQMEVDIPNAISGSISDELNKMLGSKIRNDFLVMPKVSVDHRLLLLKHATYKKAWEDVAPTWKLLLSSITERSSYSDQDRKIRLLVKSTECIRAIIDPLYISPLGHAEALLLLNFSHSRYATDILAHSLPCGSYATIKRTIQGLATNQIVIPTGDIIIGFDNNQVYQKTWGIKFKGKQKTTVVTSLVLFQDVHQTNFQKTTRLPTRLEIRTNTGEVLLPRYHLFHKKSDQVIAKHNTKIIGQRFKSLLEEKLKPQPLTADEVQSGSQPHQNKSFSYEIVEKKDSQYMVKDLTCLPLNPASTVAVKEILTEILKFKNSDPGRAWMLCYMDGSPYSLAQKIISNTISCSYCQMEVHDIVQHAQEVHRKDNLVRAVHTFGGIILRPGNGHVEMLITKSIIETFWEPFFHPIAGFLGYTTEAGLDSCRRGGDHHKAWQILTTAFAALLDELLEDFIEKHSTEKTITAKQFQAYAIKRSQTNIMYKLVYSFLFNVLAPLFIFRSALRQGNNEVALHARDYSSRILYGTAHPKYQALLSHDTLYLLSIAEDKRHLIAKETCQTTKSDVGQPFDFIVEERNKLQKSYLPADGAPSYTQWKNVCESMNELEKIRDITTHRLGINPQKSEQRDVYLKIEIEESRKYYRECFGLAEPLKEKIISSENMQIHSQFADFFEECEQNQLKYYSKYVQGQRSHLPMINNAIFPMDLESLSKEKIIKECKSILKSLSEPYFSFYRNSLKNQTTVQELQDYYAALLRQLSLQKNLEGAYD